MPPLPASTGRRARSPSFMTRSTGKGEHRLFGDGGDGGDAELVFHAVGDDGEDGGAHGMESLAPPLPAPPSHMTDDAAERLGRAIAELRLTADRLGAEVASTAIEIGCLVARRILEAELKTDVEAHRALVRSAVRRLAEEHRVTIHLAPGDLELVRAASGGPHGGGGAGTDMGFNLGIAKVEIFPDTNLTPGDCLVESDAATVDGRLGTRLEEIRRVLSSVINGHGSDAT
ncbi:MAG: FliH/SctL family protein [Polyangia bacterium]